MEEIPEIEEKAFSIRQTGASIPSRNKNSFTSMPVMLSVPYFDRLVPDDIYNTPFYFLKHVAGVYGTIQNHQKRKRREQNPLWGIGFSGDDEIEITGIGFRHNHALPDFMHNEIDIDEEEGI